jgi:hypothetical protein
MTEAPKIKIMINGDSNTIFASGARINERKVVAATTEACSETQGSRISRNDLAPAGCCRKDGAEGATSAFGEIASAFFADFVFPEP